MRSSGERLNPAFDEGTNQLEAGHLFSRCGPQLPNPLHQRLRDRYFFFGQLMCPRCTGPKNIGGLEFFEPEFLADNRLILGVEPSRPPADVVLRHAQIEVLDVRAHRAAETTGLVVERASDDEDSPPERPVGFDPQKALT
jgi:hypothetical protein